ncbi:hypothetical protein [Chitinophaga pinensis]|uniref:Carboxypeptidase regulatory-like domain-containing protein n=1 Tax=Chitinophaga pinensis TaxID=79329 RepID=A0A5C6LRN4_9BACT|nr:hypothetical protein [Chitinophaga pinensis]TWW00095.1 hypothetical protein FEF09_12145 [Chitinophaga pinensis]
MKKTLAFVYLLCCTLTLSAQSKMARYSGSIKGYNPDMGFKSVQLAVNNAVTGLYNSYFINIAPDGKFTIDIPLAREQEVWVSFPFFHSPIYIEPGKELIQDFDITSMPDVKSVFKGTRPRSIMTSTKSGIY